MHLLKISGDGNFSLTRFNPREIPPYAILSHTWEADNQELTFQDIINGAGRSKAGYRKVQFCGDQAKKEGLQYFWVDSCCIDKTSSAELSEAINSMFYWYQKAVKCYVYLSDVSKSDIIPSMPSQLLADTPLRQSRWFIRGWTLQELLAPPSLEFFSKEGEPLGDRRTLELHIRDITGIPIKALQGTPMSDFSVDERMAWASIRQTTIEEDQAYCLLGIFEIHMPLIYGEGQKNAFRRLRQEIEKNLNYNNHAKSASKREPFSTVPFAADPDFVDRPEILAWIRDKCARPGARAALVGLGGVGKSQLAIRYSHSVRDASPQMFVFWVYASTRLRFEEAYRDIADRLDLPGRDDPKIDILRLVSNWLCDEANGPWMMILDNVDSVETFFQVQKREQDEPFKSSSVSLTAYLPQSRNGSILITSRNKDVASRLAGGYNSIKEVRAMDESQGLQLLQNKLKDPSTKEGAADLLYALDYIPLAITQAAAYINRRARMTISKYLDEFRRNDEKRENLLNWDAGDLRRDEGASNSVVITWQMSFERIRQERRSAADLLSLMSFFNPQGIPESILRRHSSTLAGLGGEDEDDSAFDEDFDILQAYSLIAPTSEIDMCEIHSLVQFCTQVWLSSFSDKGRWKKKFIELMAREFPIVDFRNWTKCRQLLPHVESLYEMEFSGDDPVIEWVQVLNNVAWYMKSAQGKYNDAEKLNRRALERCEKELGEQHPSTLTSITNLASVLQDQGKYDEAEKLNRRALEGMEKKLGEQHPNTLTSINNLASVLQAQGKYDEAGKLSWRVLEGMEKELGEQHPSTLTIIYNLAITLQDQGKYGEAEKLNRRALEGRGKKLGENHHATLDSVYQLAYILGKQKQYEEASRHYQRAYNGYKQTLGSQHPETIACASNYSNMQLEAESMNGRSSQKSA